MLNYVDDIDRLAASAIRVEHFATHELVRARCEDVAAEVRAWMAVNDFDVAPLLNTTPPLFIRQEDVAALLPHEPVGTVGQPVRPAQLVARSVPLLEALEVLHEHSWFFVSQGAELEGIVTRHDLARPAVSLYLFARILSLEHGLRRLLGTYTNVPIPDAPPAEPDSADPRYLSAVLKGIRNVPDLVSSLNFDSKNAFDRGTGFIADLRNHLAHGRSILNHADDARSAVERIRDVDGLLGRVARLAAERAQVWHAFATTHIVHRQVIETVWSGPGAGSLPLPLPIHVITACNPFEQVLSIAENARRNDALCEFLAARRLEFQPVLGRSPDGSWTEPSFAVHGLSRVEACKLARLFGQRAVFELDADEFRVVTADGEVRERRRRNE